MESRRTMRTVTALEHQFIACDQVLHDTIAMISDEEGRYSDSMAKLAIALARTSTQMATIIARLDRQVGGKASADDPRSKTQ